MCLVYQVEGCWQECCAGNAVESSQGTGIFIEPLHIIHPDSLPMNQEPVQDQHYGL